MNPLRLKTKDQVLLTTDNPYLNGAPAVVQSLESWGAFVSCDNAATGVYRASWDEMVLPQKAYSGNVCTTCGGVRLRRTGPCEVCEDCGTSNGCS